MNHFFTRRMVCLAVLVAVALTAAGLLTPATGAKPPKDPPKPPPLPPIRYSITWLGTLSGGKPTGDGRSVTGINELGQVVGTSVAVVTLPDGTTKRVFHAYLWTQGTGMVDLNSFLPTGSPWELAEARGINNNGQVVGLGLLNGEAQLQAFRFTPGHTDDSGQWVAAVIDHLPTLGGTTTQPYGINDLGDVTGFSTDAGGKVHAFVYSGESGLMFPIDIGQPNLYSSRGKAINFAGQVTGEFGVRNSNGTVSYYAFRYTPGMGMETLVLKPSYPSDGLDINDRGQVVGSASTKGSTGPHAFRYTDGVGVLDLGALSGGSSKATAINTHGDVVGSANVGTRWHGVVYIDGFGMINLDDLVDRLAGDELWDSIWNIWPQKINANGQICGYIASPSNWVPFLLTPEVVVP